MEKLLIVDDEHDLLAGLQRLAESELDCQVLTASSGKQALGLMENHSIGVLLSDIRMPGLDGMELLDAVTSGAKSIDVILMTAYGSIDQAVLALQKGAADFVTKPLHHEHLFHILRKCFERRKLINRNQQLEKEVQRRGQRGDDFIGNSSLLAKVLDTIKRVAGLEVTVLITGESGTGKELAARTLHQCSDRSSRRMIGINCAALPESVLESELFGHRKGAFTGAERDYPGLFVAAHDSTLFLDEIGEMALPLQARLLRVLQEREVRPLGDTGVRRINTRVLASTNRNLEEMVAQGAFREDLYFRLAEIPLTMPPLREIPEDIPLLATHFMQRFSGEYGRPNKTLSPETTSLLCKSPWPGNVRQLQNVLKRAILLIEEQLIQPDHLQLEGPAPLCSDTAIEELVNLRYRDAKSQVLSIFSTSYFSHLLKSTGGNISQAARICGLERQSLQQLLRKFQIDANQFRN